MFLNVVYNLILYYFDYLLPVRQYELLRLNVRIVLYVLITSNGLYIVEYSRPLVIVFIEIREFDKYNIRSNSPVIKSTVRFSNFMFCR